MQWQTDPGLQFDSAKPHLTFTMAKVVSSKPYATGSGKKPSPPKKTLKNSPKSPQKTVSPVRTSPRKRANNEDEKDPVKMVEKVSAKPTQVKKQKKRSVPQPPAFNEERRVTRSPRKSPQKNEQNIEQVSNEAAVFEAEPVQEAEVELRRSPRRASIEAQQKLVVSKLVFEDAEDSSIFTQESSQQLEESENSPVLMEEASQETDEENNPFLDSDVDEYAEEFDTEDEDDLGEGYNAQFERHSSTASVIKQRIQQYFAGRSQSEKSESDSAVWKRVTSWIGQSLVPTARELTQVITQKTLELTKTAIEQLNAPRKNQQHVNVDDEDEEVIYEELIEDYENDQQFEDEETMNYHREISKEYEEEEAINSSPKRMKIDPVHVSESFPVAEFEPAPQVSIVVEARLTEIVLFFARCNATTPTPTIYEHLEEFFRLKSESSLNPTERQLIHNVLKEYLSVGSISLTPSLPPTQISREVSEEGRKMADMMATSAIMNDSPNKSIRLPASGVRFRAPTFSAEEEAQIDAMIDSRKKQQQASNQKESKTLSTTGVRSRLQRKLLDLDRTIEIFESIPTVVDGRDSIQAAINSIINEKMKHAKQKEEEERAETEKLKARIVELEKERKERELKEALLSQQLKERSEKAEEKKPAFDFGAPVKVTDSSSSASASLPSTKPDVSLLANQLPSATTALNPAAASFKPAFTFGAKTDDKATADKAQPALSSFSFGSSASVTPVTTETAKPAFNFGSQNNSSSDSKPAFSFGDSKPVESKPAFSFGDAKSSESKSAFSFGEAKPTESKPAFSFGDAKLSEAKSAFSFGDSKPAEAKTAFSFGDAKPAEAKPVFTFGDSKLSEAKVEAKSAFSFGDTKPSEAKVEAKPAFSFGDSKPSPAFSFGDSKPAEPKTSFSFGSSSNSDTKPSFSFGESKPLTEAKPAFSFATSSEAKPAFTSMATESKPSFGSLTNESKPAFQFGTSTNESKPSFQFGSSASEPKPAFQFGSEAKPSFPTSNDSKPAFNFGSSTPAANPFASLSGGFGSSLQPSTSAAFSNVFASSLASSQSNNSNNIFGQLPPSSPSPQPQSAVPVFNFGQAAPTTSFVPMNFGSSAANNSDASSAAGFDTGNRTISVPKRRLRR